MVAAGLSEPNGSLDGRVAVVIGASRGIGKGIAVELALAGAHVVVAGRTLDPAPGPSGSLAETVALIAELGGGAEAVRCDVTDDEQIAALFARIGERSGRLDVLVNAAFDTPGFRSTIDVPFWELPISIWHDVVDLGTRSIYVACAHATPLMLGGGGGTIVNISARGAETYRYNVAYGVGKAAVDRMTRDMAHELRDRQRRGRVGLARPDPHRAHRRDARPARPVGGDERRERRCDGDAALTSAAGSSHWRLTRT